MHNATSNIQHRKHEDASTIFTRQSKTYLLHVLNLKMSKSRNTHAKKNTISLTKQTKIEKSEKPCRKHGDASTISNRNSKKIHFDFLKFSIFKIEYGQKTSVFQQAHAEKNTHFVKRKSKKSQIRKTASKM